MKKTAIYLVLFLSFTGCSIFKNESSLKINVEELGYGIGETKSVSIKTMDNSPTGTHRLSKGFTITQKTDTIPGEIGKQFGVVYIMHATIYKDILVEQVWTFPAPMVDDNGKEFKELRYQILKSTNEETYSTYFLEKEYEVIKGEWIYQMFYDDQKIFERKFYIE